MNYILFDIGGTKTRVSLSQDLETFCEPLKYDTPTDDFAEGIAKLKEAVAGLCGDGEVAAVAGGIRGVLDHDRTMVMNDPGHKIVGWEKQPLVEELSAAFNAPAYIENDTAIVGLGEAHYGAGKGSEIMAYHTVSTGVGGVRIMHGSVDETTVGFEVGHQILDVDRSVLGEKVVNTLENIVSGGALEERLGKKAYEIPQEDKIWDELAFYLSRGLRNTSVYWSPDTIVLGGSMIVGDPRILLEDIKKHTKESLGDFFPCPKLVDAELGDFGGLYGAMALLKQRL